MTLQTTSPILADAIPALSARAASHQSLLARERQARLEAERAGARAGLLARTSAVFDVSLDTDHALATLGRVCVPEFASLCVIDLIEDGGAARRAVVCHHEPDIGDLEGRAGDPMSTFAAFACLTRPALTEKRSKLVRHLSDADLGLLDGDEACRRLWRHLSTTSYMCAPLLVHGEVVGAIAVVAGLGRRHYDPVDLSLLEEIACRASLAMENAHRFAKARCATRLREDVLAVVAHDLRNPLAAISMAIGRLKEMPELTGDNPTRLLRIAGDSVEWMQRMIQDLLDVASIDAGRLSIEQDNADPVILLVHAGALFERMFADQAITFTLDLPETLPPVRADYERILQVVGNLLSNAAKFTPPAGQVTLAARARENEVVVSVCDSGCGVLPSHVPHVFDRFWQARRGAKTRGTGLGLSIAKGIIDAHGGRIWIDTPPAGGSVFSFALPRAEMSGSENAPRG